MAFMVSSANTSSTDRPGILLQAVPAVKDEFLATIDIVPPSAAAGLQFNQEAWM
jgi:hypothetical protein